MSKKISGGASLEIDALYQAAYNYVVANGGTIAEIGPLQITEHGKAAKFTLSIQCMGTKPLKRGFGDALRSLLTQ